MRQSWRGVAAWVDDRTGWGSACRHFLFEDIPLSAGWAQAFGSVAVFLFLMQALTGSLLAFNFAPTPGNAYTSLQYIIHQVTAGHMIHGLHHWGSSLMIIVVFVHMAQVFIYGAYKKPREFTWTVGAILLLATLVFALTGYLLPWDNRAYWGTMVTTRIMASVPIAGNMFVTLAGAANGIGVLTFSRFYTLHTLILPMGVVFLIAAHVYLVRRHGIAPASSDDPKSQKFFPSQAFRDVVCIFVVFVGLFLSAAYLDAPLERIADQTDTAYIPRPEWYFLFLFELLKIFDGALQLIGTVILPTLAVILLFSVPFLPIPWLRGIYGRWLSAALVAAVFIAWAGLTGAAVWRTPQTVSAGAASPEQVRWAQVPPEEIAGMGYFSASHCGSCHNLVAGKPKLGPNLAGVSLHHPKEWLVQHFQNPAGDDSGNVLSLAELNSLSLFLVNLNPESEAVLQEMSPEFIKGAQVFVTNACGSCHKVNGSGGGIGPPLNGLPERRSKKWVLAHFASPRKLSPGSIMPPFHFSQPEQESLMQYLYSLPE